RLQAGEHAQEARLADAARPQERDDLALGEIEAEAAQHRLVGAVIAQADVAGAQRRSLRDDGGDVHAAFCLSSKAALSCTRLGVMTGTKAASRQRRAKDLPGPARYALPPDACSSSETASATISASSIRSSNSGAALASNSRERRPAYMRASALASCWLSCAIGSPSTLRPAPATLPASASARRARPID